MAKEIKRFKIDLRKASDYVDEEFERIICESLRINDLFSNDFLYSFFDYSNYRRVLRSGSTRDTSDNIIYAFNKTQLYMHGERPNCTARSRFWREDLHPALAIYDRQQLKPAYITESNYGYEFLSPENKREALIGMAELLLKS